MSYRVLQLEPSSDAPRSARAALGLWMQSDGLAALRDDVVLVASELVTNAVVHAATTMELSYRGNRSTVEIAVRDQDRHPPRLSRASDGEVIRARESATIPQGGRGLMLVSTLADEWGVTETWDGKRVWARWSVRTTAQSDPLDTPR